MANKVLNDFKLTKIWKKIIKTFWSTSNPENTFTFIKNLSFCYKRNGFDFNPLLHAKYLTFLPNYF